jgi:hypothetical protein
MALSNGFEEWCEHCVYTWRRQSFHEYRESVVGPNRQTIRAGGFDPLFQLETQAPQLQAGYGCMGTSDCNRDGILHRISFFVRLANIFIYCSRRFFRHGVLALDSQASLLATRSYTHYVGAVSDSSFSIPSRPHQNRASFFEENLAVAEKAQLVTLTPKIDAWGDAENGAIHANRGKKKQTKALTVDFCIQFLLDICN